jgi:nitrogen fixation protein FixH
MSYIRWIPSPSPGGSLWRFFPIGVIAAMGVVVAVNGGMVYVALHGFPGQAGEEDFALSNHYDAVLERVQREAALGWTLSAQADDTGRPVVTLVDRNRAPLRGASVTGFAERPLGAPQTQQLMFRETAAGRYVGSMALPKPGQWDLTLSASADGHAVAATRRVIVR